MKTKLFSLKHSKDLFFGLIFILGIQAMSLACDKTTVTAIATSCIGGNVAITFELCDSPSNSAADNNGVYGIFIQSNGANIVGTNTPSLTGQASGMTINFSTISATTAQYGNWANQVAGNEFIDYGDPIECHTFTILFNAVPTSVTISGSTSNVNTGGGLQQYQGEWACFQTVQPTCTAGWTSAPKACTNGASINLDNYVLSPGGTYSGPGVTGNTFNPAGLSGNVVITHTVSLGCGGATCSSNITINVTNFTPPNIPPQNTCVGLGVNLNATTTGSGYNFSYSWSPSTGLSCTNCANPTASPTTTTTYTVTVTETNSGCVKQTTATVNVTPTTNIPPNPAGPFACGGSAVTMTTNATAGGTWSASCGSCINSSTGSFNPNTANPGNHTITYNSGYPSCEGGSITVNVANCPPVSICYDGTNLSATGGNGSYTWAQNTGILNAWQNVGTGSPIAASVFNATKKIRVTTGDGQTVTYNTLADVPSCGSLSICYNGSSLEVSNGTPAYTWSVCTAETSGSCTSWTVVDNDFQYTTSATTGMIKVVDSNGGQTILPNGITGVASCSVACTPPTISIAGTNVLCNGQNNGAANLTITSGSSTYSFLWSNSATSEDLTNLTAGTYNVTVTDNADASCSATGSVVISQPPALITNFSAPTVCAGLATNFTDASSAGVDSWNWDFDNNGTVDNTTQNPSHTFPSAGTYPVNLEVSVGGNCSHDTTINVTVSQSSIASFTAPTVCAGLATNFTNTSSAGVDTWNWDFDNNGTVDNTTQNPSHTFPSAGTYPVNLEVSVGGSCVHDTTINVTVSQSSTASFTAPTVCVGLATNFTDVSSAGVDTWNWDFDNNGIVDNTSQNPSHTFPSAGTYPVNLEVSVGGSCIHDTTINVTVSQSSTANFTAPTTCVGLATNFTDASIGGVDTWNWDFDNNGSVDNSSQNPSHTFPTAGTYPVNLQVSVGGNCSHDTTINIIVTPNPTAAFTFTNVCFGTTTGFTNQSNGNGGTINQWAWDFTNNGSVDNTTQNPTNGYTAAGSYTVELMVTTTAGCKDSVTMVVPVDPIPVANFSGTNECLGTTTTFIDSSSVLTGSIASWAWNFGDGSGTSITPSPTYNYTSSGIYNVTLTVTSDSGCISNFNRNIQVYANPVANFVTDTACNTFATSFTDLTTIGNTAIQTWGWDFDNNTTVDNTNQNPTFILPTAGAHSVNLYVEDSHGCNHDTTITVIVSENPIANFNHTIECFGTSTTFTDASNNNGGTMPIDTWEWDFDGNGTIDNSTQSPTFNFPSAGTYQTELFVTSTLGCMDSITIAVVVDPIPVADFSATTECLEFTTTFTNNSTVATGSITQNSWDFADGTGTSTLLSPTYTYSSSGTFNVELTVTSDSGCVHSIIVPVIVHPKPTANFNVANVCLNVAAPITDASLGNGGTVNQWGWDFTNNGTTDNITQNPSHLYTSDGTFDIRLIATTTDGCKDTIIKPVTIYPMPIANFTYVNTCFGSDVDFTSTSNVSSGTIDVWDWSFGNGQTSIIENPSHLYASEGLYDVQLIVTTNNNCKDTIIRNGIEVWPLPSVDFIPTTVCLNNVTQFEDQSTISNIYTTNTIVNWTWDFADGTTSSNNQNPTHTYTTEGVYQATLVVTTNNNCVDSITKDVTVHPLPIVDFSANNLMGCTPVCVTFTNSSTISSGNITQLAWDFNSDGITDNMGQNPGNCFLNPSNSSVRDFDITLTATSQYGCSSTLTKLDYIHSYPIPSASFTYWPNDEASIVDNDITFTDESIIGSIWNWDLGDGSTSNVENPTHEYQDSGFYLVTLAIENVYGCRDTTQKYVNIKPIYAIWIPNAFTPDGDFTNDFFFVDGYGIKELKVQIFDRWGLKLYDEIGVDQSWDGTYKGNLVQTDVYVYKIRAKDIFDEWHDYIGKVTVIK